MKPVLHNFRKRRFQAFRAGIVSLMLFSFVLPSPSLAISMGKLKGNSGFRAVVIAVANLNIAMQQATINPQDKTRRQNVAIAYSMMPLAITALAKEFKSNQLHNGDFQFVQGILGGFIQKDLHSKVEDFMKNPSRQNIPSVGDNFPQEALKQAEQSYLVANKEKSLMALTNEDGSPKQAQSSGLSDLADLSGRSASNTSSTENSTIVANKKKSLLNSSETASEPGAKSSGEFKEELTKEITKTETNSNSAKELDRAPASQTKIVAPSSSVEDGLDKEFFKEKKKATREEKEKRKVRKGNQLKSENFLKSKRTPWISYLIKTWIPLAAAAPEPAPANESGCQDCQNGGGGGGGGGGGAADILFGLAAMIAAAAPMVAAAIQADADKKIAQINANTAITNANTQAELQRYTMDQQTGLARAQAEATEKMAQEKNQKEMTQLQLQLAELQKSREQQAALVREERQLAQFNLDREIAQQQQLAEQRIQLAQQERLNKLATDGLNTGLQNVRDPGNRLEISRVASTGGFAANGNNLMSNNVNRNPASSNANGPVINSVKNQPGSASAGASSNVPAGSSTSAASLGLALKKPTSQASSISANLNGKSGNAKTAQTLLVSATASTGSSSKAFQGRGLVSTVTAKNLPARGFAKVAQGSTRMAKLRLEPQTEELQQLVGQPLVAKNNNPVYLTSGDRVIKESNVHNQSGTGNHQINTSEEVIQLKTLSRGVRSGGPSYGGE